MITKGRQVRSLLFILSIIFIHGNFTMLDAQPKKKKGKQTKAAAATVVQTAPPEINYTVSMSKPWTHLLEVEMRLKPSIMADTAEIQMPVWTPGSYLVREYARHVQDFAAKDSSGNSL